MVGCSRDRGRGGFAMAAAAQARISRAFWLVPATAAWVVATAGAFGLIATSLHALLPWPAPTNLVALCLLVTLAAGLFAIVFYGDNKYWLVAVMVAIGLVALIVPLLLVSPVLGSPRESTAWYTAWGAAAAQAALLIVLTKREEGLALAAGRPERGGLIGRGVDNAEIVRRRFLGFFSADAGRERHRPPERCHR